MKSTLTILFFILITLPFLHTQTQTIHLEGTVQDVTSEGFYLVKSRSNHNDTAFIPLEQGHFSYQLQAPFNEGYYLAYKEEVLEGAWRPIIFFSDTTHIQFNLHSSDNFLQNEITGGEDNRAYQHYYNQAITAWHEEWEPRYASAKNGEDTLQVSLDYFQSQYDAMMTSPSILSLWFFYREWQDISLFYQTGQGPINVTPQEYSFRYEYLQRALSEMSSWFPQHIYTKKTNLMATAITEIKPGKPYRDVSVLTMDLQKDQLSRYVDGKVTLLNLWGSWCGPCIRKIKALQPILDQYDSEEAHIVGIAREFGTTDPLEQALQRHKFSWTNFVELDDRHNVWATYGMENAAGIIFLIDAEGIIRSVNPSEEELATLLADLLD